MGRGAALLMIFVPCSPVAAWRMESLPEVWAKDGSSAEVSTREKTDHGKGTTVLLLRKGPVANLYVVHAYNLLKGGYQGRRV